MTPRRFLFWLHLIAGSLAGLLILSMATSGILMSFRRQITNFPERAFRSAPPSGETQSASLQAIVRDAQTLPLGEPTNLTLRADPSAPVEISFGRESIFLFNPYSGQPLGEGARRLRHFFASVEQWHRWLAGTGLSQETGRSITHACALFFFFLICSGIYLWWPRSLTRNALKNAVTFRPGLSARAREYNWHSVVGFWLCLPLFVIVFCGIVMAFPWANNFVYRVMSSEPPPAPRSVDAQRQQQQRRDRTQKQDALALDHLDALIARAKEKQPSWRSISLRLPRKSDTAAVFTIDTGNGGRPDLRSQLTLDVNSASELKWELFSSFSRGRQLRTWIRFTHTGEVAGWPGQAVAALGAIFLVYTGLSMALRRLAQRWSRERKITASITANLDRKAQSAS